MLLFDICFWKIDLNIMFVERVMMFEGVKVE